MLISDMIADHITELLDKSGGTAVFRRNDLAEQLGCVPSQINYVISSRFTASAGYIIESRRGGGGYIRIIRREAEAAQMIADLIDMTGEELRQDEAARILDGMLTRGLVTLRERTIAGAAIHPVSDPRMRADVVRRILQCLR